MTKVISIVLAMLIVLTILPLGTLAIENVDEQIGDLQPIEPIKLDNKTPCYGEYEILANENEYSVLAADEKDQYESNNSFSASTMLKGQPNGRPSNFTVSRDATLHRESWLWGAIQRDIDEDYYRLDIFGNAQVAITMSNIPTGCDYDIKLFVHDNKINAASDDITQIAVSSRGGTSTELISTTLSPGTYYLWVYPYSDECNDSAFYHLTVNVSYSAKDIDISSLKYDKGAKAALWISDYNPCGLLPYSHSGEVGVGYMDAESTTPKMRFDNPFFDYFTSGNQVNQAVLYIWDKEIIESVQEVIDETYDATMQDLQYDEQVQIRWERFENIVGGGATAASIIVSFYSLSPFDELITNVVITAAPIVATLTKDIAAPGDSISTKEDYLEYLSEISRVLEIVSATDNGVVKLNYSYRYTYKHPIGMVHTDYYFDFTPLPQSSYMHLEDLITAWDTTSVVNGTIYGIRDFSDAENAKLHGSNYLPDVNTSELYNIFLDSSIPGALDVGEYHWFEFIAPIEGTYAFFTENSGDTVGELFNNTVSARSMTGMLKSDDDSGENGNFRITYDLSASQKVFLRVHDYDWDHTLNYSLRVELLS